jgi:outer membrane receptor for ferrienterochelin and colicins
LRRDPHLLAAMLACAASGLRAQAVEPEPAPPPTPQRVEIRGNEVSDTEQQRRRSVATSIVGREELDRFGDVSVTDVLRRTPGVDVQGGAPRLRGLGSGYTLILVNGERAPPGFSLENLPPSQVERIEITKGPTAEFSAQAVAGTINVILRQPVRMRQRELRLGAGYQLERPVGSVHATWADQWGPVGVALPASLYQWRGGNEWQSERFARDLNLDPQHLRSRGQSRWWGYGGSFGPRLSWRLGEGRTLDLNTFLQRHEFRSAGESRTTVLAGATPPSVHDENRNGGYWQMLRTGLQFTRRLPEGGRYELRASGQVSDSQARTDGLGRNASETVSVVRLNRARTEEASATAAGKIVRPVGDAHTLAAGFEVESRRREESRTALENGQPQLADYEGQAFVARIERQALWAQDEWELAPRLSAYLGLRAERIALRSQGPEDVITSASQVVTPMGHLNFRLDPQGKDLLRASLTRAYRAPDLNRLVARPAINTTYPVDRPNPPISPDRVGNPQLQPELSTGLDVAFEKYLATNGVVSIGGFVRHVDGLIRNVTRLEVVPWASVPRWVSRPVNLGPARSVGLEFEVKGQAAELWPALKLPAGLALRGSLSVYRSRVQGVPGPDNRLEGQQPWSAKLGFDHAWAGSTLTFGASVAQTPGFPVQQTAMQRFEQSERRAIDAYLLLPLSRQVIWRLAVNNAWPLTSATTTAVVDEDGSVQRSLGRTTSRTSFNASLTLKF